MANLTNLGLPPQLADDGVAPATAIAFTEGPAAHTDGRVFFTDIRNCRIMCFNSRSGETTVFRSDSGRANGLLLDAQQRLLACEGNEMGPGGRRRITRTDLATGRLEVLTERFEGRRYNSPNDILATSDGWMFFTDPVYDCHSPIELDQESVYRIAPDGSVTRALSQPDIDRPNGISLSPDERSVYVVDSHRGVGRNRKLWVFDLTEEKTLVNRRLIHDFAPGRGGDGMAIDQKGCLYVAAGIHRPRGPWETADNPAGVYVFTPTGELQGRIPVPEDVITNVTFGGDDLRTLYITAGKSLFQARVNTPGFVVHRT